MCQISLRILTLAKQQTFRLHSAGSRLNLSGGGGGGGGGLLRSLVASFQISENNGLLKRVCTAISFMMGSSVSVMATGTDECCIDAEIDSSFIIINLSRDYNWKMVINTFPGEIKKGDVLTSNYG